MSPQEELEYLFQQLIRDDGMRAPHIEKQVTQFVIDNQQHIDIELIKRNLRNSNPYLREIACRLFKVIKATDAVQSLIDVLWLDDDYDVRAAAADALGHIGDISALEPLQRYLEKPLASQLEIPTYEFVSGAILMLDDPSVPQLLISIIGRSYGEMDSELHNMRELLLDDMIQKWGTRCCGLLFEGLEKIDTDSSDSVYEHIDRKTSIQIRILYRLAMLQCPGTLDRLRMNLDHTDSDMREACAEIIERYFKNVSH